MNINLVLAISGFDVELSRFIYPPKAITRWLTAKAATQASVSI
jgi:hypothetical protein